MNKEISTVTIEQLEESYKRFSTKSRDDGKRIASSISMLQLDKVGDEIVKAVQEIEGIVQRATEKSFMSRLPLVGKYIDKASASVEKEKLRSGSVSSTVDSLFRAMSEKQSQITGVMETLFDTRERLVQEHGEMLLQEKETKELAGGTGLDAFKARNLLVQLQQAIIKTQERVSIIDATIKSAEASSLQISGMLPTLQGELITEISIQAGLQELKDYKEVFDKTVSVVEDLSGINSNSMQEVLLNVADLAVLSPVNLARLEQTESKRVEFQKQIREKMETAHRKQAQSLESLQNIRNIQGDNFTKLLEQEK